MSWLRKIETWQGVQYHGPNPILIRRDQTGLSSQLKIPGSWHRLLLNIEGFMVVVLGPSSYGTVILDL